MIEDYVGVETAKLLKEKGFYQDFYNSLIPVWHYNGNKKVLSFTEDDGYPSETQEWYSAPTLQMAMKWLREVHHYYIQVMLDGWACGGHMGYYVVIQKTDSDFEMMLQDVRDRVFYDTPEEAAEDAIKYIVENLI